MIYLDTSAVLLVLLAQPGHEAVSAHLAATEDRLLSSALLELEVFRALRREKHALAVADTALRMIGLCAINDAVIDRAKALTGELKSLDAIHLATALILHDPRDPVTVLTHDARLAKAARAQGLRALDPAEPSA
ncbi:MULTISPECIES: PIN domain-containing protein [unclassified Actinomyces]|uniref:PIN domain-containing protein n=1 Tax=unclassified Actinomyces TaxID=2609248 RepID=UPI000D594DD5|nr:MULTISPECIES: PIN domain-containing protein [unclassified Actinomyces]RAX21935.1 PIN domain-containing protein [Actinomyces sp. Z5]RAX22375.1 PIN domain-containing protein [Actinomyces sp. Z3]